MLGEGAFGIVMKAEACGLGDCDGCKVVAVKMLKGDHIRVACKVIVRIVLNRFRISSFCE